MSDSPRTDKLIAELDANHEVAIPFVWRQMVNLARQLESALAAMTAQREALERRSQEREAWLLGHISEEEHMRFVERFQ